MFSFSNQQTLLLFALALRSTLLILHCMFMQDHSPTHLKRKGTFLFLCVENERQTMLSTTAFSKE